MAIKLKNITHPEKYCPDAVLLKRIFLKLLTELKKDSLYYKSSSVEDMQCVGYRFIVMLSHESSINSISNAYNMLKKYWGISCSNDFKILIEQYATKLKHAGYNYISVIKRPSKRSSHHKEFDINSCQCKQINHRDNIKDVSRAVVCRGMHGNYGYKIYEITGPAISKNDKECRINEVKMRFHYDTGCPYYEVRPILWTSWINLPDNKRVGTK